MSTKFYLRSVAATAAFMAVALAPVHAAPETFFAVDSAAGGSVPANSLSAAKKADFLSTLSTSTSEGFETLTPGAPPSAASPLSIFSGAAKITQTLDPLGLNSGNLESSSANGRFNTTGGASSGLWWRASMPFTITFGAAINAFGFYITDLGDFAGAMTLHLYSGDTLLDDVAVGSDPGKRDGSLAFFALSTASYRFNRIVFDIAQASGTAADSYDQVGFDDLVIGERATGGGTAPEPASLALAGLSLGLLAAARRRKLPQA